MAGAEVIREPPRRRGRLARVLRFGTLRCDPGARALPGHEPTLRDELPVGLRDSVPRDAEVRREGPRGREQGSSRQTASLDGGPQGVLETGSNGASLEVEVQIQSEIGPMICHTNGSYSWSFQAIAL